MARQAINPLASASSMICRSAVASSALSVMQSRPHVLIVVPQGLVVGGVQVIVVLALRLAGHGEYLCFPWVGAAVNAVDDPAPVQPPEQGQVGVEVEPPGEVGDVASSAQGFVGGSVVVQVPGPQGRPVKVAAD